MKKTHWPTIIILGVFAGIILVPIVLTLIYSFCSIGEIKDFLLTRNRYDDDLMELKVIPQCFSLDQYWNILIEDMTILRYYMNSILYAGAILLGQVVLVPMLAYALSRYQFRSREALSFLVIVLLIMPFQVTMVPVAITIRTLGLMDTVWSIILPSIVSPFYVFLLRQSMLGIPNELFEAAQIDGSSAFRCFLSIVLPVSRPVIGAAIALSFADCWNMVEQPLVFLPRSDCLRPLSVEFNQLSVENSDVQFAGATLYMIPAILIYLLFQKDIVTGISLAELK